MLQFKEYTHDDDGLKRVPTITIRLILIVVKTHLQEFRGFNSIFVIAFYITVHPFMILITITFSFDVNYSDLWGTILPKVNLNINFTTNHFMF